VPGVYTTAALGDFAERTGGWMASLPERMIGAMKADVKTFQEIEADQNALGQAVTVIVIAGVASLIGNIFRQGVMFGVVSLVLTLIAYAVWSVMVVLVGTKLMPEPTTKADFAEGFRVIGFTASPGVFNVLAIIPFLGPLLSFLIGIWMLILGVIAAREVLDYSNTGRALIVCLIAFAVTTAVYVILWLMLMVPLMVAGAAMS
jgi:Yip1 domain